MDSARGVLVLTTEPETEAAVASAVRAEAELVLRAPCRNLQELVAQLRQTPARAAVIDLDPQPERMLALLDPVISHFGETRFIVTTRGSREQLVNDAMLVGARLLLAKDTLRADLAGVLKRVAANGTAKGAGLGGSRGLLVAVLSAGGGCGSTFLSVNLANEFHLLTKAPVLLVDMDSVSSTVGTYLGLQTEYGLARLLADGQRIDGELIRSTAAIYDQTLHVLLNTGGPRSSGAPGGGAAQYEHLARLLGAAKATFDYTIVDAPRSSGDQFSSLAAEASLVVVPFQLTVIGIRAAKGVMGALGEAGCPPDHILPVATRYRKRRTMIGLDEAAKALGRSDIGTIRNDFKAAVSSMNFGQPLAKSAPRSKPRTDIQRLALHIHAARAAGTPVGGTW